MFSVGILDVSSSISTSILYATLTLLSTGTWSARPSLFAVGALYKLLTYLLTYLLRSSRWYRYSVRPSTRLRHAFIYADHTVFLVALPPIFIDYCPLLMVTTPRAVITSDSIVQFRVNVANVNGRSIIRLFTGYRRSFGRQEKVKG